MKSMLSTQTRAKTRRLLHNKVVLVTGGTGSFGKSIVNALLTFKPKEVRVYSRSEDKQDAMRFLHAGNPRIKFILGDIRDPAQTTRATTGVDIVFHAAAQKQVPASEENVWEAIHTNVIGAQNIIDACFINKVKIAIAISTDKAVEPVNAMGMTKALQEKLFISANTHRHRGSCRFSVVRYGNVLGSTGSVLPVFLKQIASKTPLTVTDTRMTRFLITLEQAVELVFLAMAQTVGGEIFIPDIPTHNVIDMAHALLSITSPTKQSTRTSVHTSGIRPGEKIHETLISPNESVRTVKKQGYFVVLPELRMSGIIAAYGHPKKKDLFRFSSDMGTKLSQRQLEKILTSHFARGAKDSEAYV